MAAIGHFGVEPRARGMFAALLGLLAAGIASGFYVRDEPAVTDLLVCAAIGFGFAAGLVRIPAGASVMLTLLGVYVFANLVSSVFSFDFGRSNLYMAVTIYLLMSSVLIAFLLVEDEERAKGAVWSGYVCGAAIAAAAGFAGVFDLVPGSDDLHRNGRAMGFFKDPNVYGPFIVPAALYVFARYESRPGARAVLHLPLLAFLIGGAFVSFSRGAWGNLAVSFAVYLGLRVLGSGRAGLGRLAFAAIAAALVAGAAAAWILLDPHLSWVFANKAQPLRNYDSVRFENQAEGLTTALLNPIGIGPGLAEQQLQYAAHSLYVRLLLENGWAGALSFLGLLGTALWKGLALVRARLAEPRFIVAYACTAGILLNSFVIDTLHWRHFFILIGLLWGDILIAGIRARAAAERRRNALPPRPGR